MGREFSPGVPGSIDGLIGLAVTVEIEQEHVVVGQPLCHPLHQPIGEQQSVHEDDRRCAARPALGVVQYQVVSLEGRHRRLPVFARCPRLRGRTGCNNAIADEGFFRAETCDR